MSAKCCFVRAARRSPKRLCRPWAKTIAGSMSCFRRSAISSATSPGITRCAVRRLRPCFACCRRVSPTTSRTVICTRWGRRKRERATPRWRSAPTASCWERAFSPPHPNFNSMVPRCRTEPNVTDSMRKGIVSEITKRCLRGLREYWILIAALGWAVATWLYFSTDWAERTFKEGPTTETKIDHLKVFSQYIIGLAGALAFALAAWRSWTAHLQAKTAIRQTEIAERGQNVERYAKAAEMIGSERLAVRQAGIYALRELALIDRKVSGQVVLRLLSGFCRDRDKQTTTQHKPGRFARRYLRRSWSDPLDSTNRNL